MPEGTQSSTSAKSDRCQAVIYHGPGHQSRTRCTLRGEHRQHHADIMGGAYFWKGDEAISGFFDESPEEEGE